MIYHLQNDRYRMLQVHGTVLEAQVRYFQQITPWMDVKVRELRAEQVHNTTYNVGRVLEHVRTWQRQTLPHVQPDFSKV